MNVLAAIQGTTNSPERMRLQAAGVTAWTDQRTRENDRSAKGASVKNTLYMGCCMQFFPLGM